MVFVSWAIAVILHLKIVLCICYAFDYFKPFAEFTELLFRVLDRVQNTDQKTASTMMLVRQTHRDPVAHHLEAPYHHGIQEIS
jgi:hypothetical protein